MRNGALVGVLAAAAVAIVLVMVFAVGPSAFGQKSSVPPRPDGKGKTIVGRTKYAAEDTVCREQLAQVREAIQIATDPVEGTFPSSLAETKLGSTLTSCPVGKEPYVYDPQTGVVHCPHRGHENY